MICIMKLSLTIVRKTKITFLLSKTVLFFFLKKSLYFLILGKVVFMSPQNSIASAFCFAEADTKKEIC